MSLYGRNNDWSKLYPLLQLLWEREVQFQNYEHPFSIKKIIRNDESGIVSYTINEDKIIVEAQDSRNEVNIEDCAQAAKSVWALCKVSHSDRMECPEYDKLFEKLLFSWFHTTGDSPLDLTLILSSPERDETITIPTIIKSTGQKYYLLSPNRSGNIKYDILNVKLANPEVSKINGFEGETAVIGRLNEIGRLGGKLKYTSPENKFFTDNLSLIDLHLPRLYSELVKTFYYMPETKLEVVTEELKTNNPYKIKDELIHGYHFYEYKIKQLLYAFDSGMKPTKIYKGYPPQAYGRLITDRKGNIRLFDSRERQFYENFLFENCRLGASDSESHKCGYIEKENGQWLFKLNCYFYI